MLMEVHHLPGDPDLDIRHAQGQEVDPVTVQPTPQLEERGLIAAQLRGASPGQSQAQWRGQGQGHDGCDNYEQNIPIL